MYIKRRSGANAITPMPFVQLQKGIFRRGRTGPKTAVLRQFYERTFFTDAKVSAEAPGSAMILS